MRAYADRLAPLDVFDSLGTNDEESNPFDGPVNTGPVSNFSRCACHIHFAGNGAGP